VQSGWRTAAVGWYNPYCSIYAPDIQDCYWTDHDMQDGPMSQSATLAANISSPLHQLAVELISPARADRDLCAFDLRLRRQTEDDLEQHALQLLHTDQADFVFLHLAIPHSPNTWSRARNGFTGQCGSSYLDNLALTDRVLGQLLATLQSSPRWGQTTLIVQGDHGWRTAIWRGLPAWTDEDEQASRGLFDPRPALLIHQPSQIQPQTVSTPWPLIQVHSVVEQILHQQTPTL
jgi:membrane-anchored protein YejM (alkaline phosphatase superfamily)